MSLRDELRQDWDAPSIADEALLESLTGETRRALCRYIRQEIVSAFDEGASEGEIIGRRAEGYERGNTLSVRAEPSND